MIKQYKDWAPLQFDPKGLNLSNQQDWLVAPVIWTRDSGALEESNFRVVLKALDGESNMVEVHRFGHWGPGWFEIILCHPSLREALEYWQIALENYPIADEMDFNKLKHERAQDAWADMNLRERIEACSRNRISILAARHEWYPADLQSYLGD